MIEKLNHREPITAKAMLAVQLPAYRIEADIIGFDDIPPLRDTAETIMASEETFVGYWLEEELAGFISYELDEHQLGICRMVVHPQYFRRGIAKGLLSYVLTGAGEQKRITVSTGAKNEPAKALYRSFRFTDAGEIEVAPEVSLALFELPAIRQ
ncbi:GNAT family N-acetyltransferase [Paenibacillus paeoniae]|uniref:GNAT family N-acetyltransferase n=1 Tax=Paenibacillus paeoniae TaxID=2292705 RepID=A0A371P6Q3_9BACL|nr:GNAT family N-acetyltransferase [Paenibacillus paeoniae]REK71156.1 GNAT family N-acetyltransferase [Paenibacillus paeoniae]